MRSPLARGTVARSRSGFWGWHHQLLVTDVKPSHCGWIYPFFWKGWKRTLEVEDIYDPLKVDQSVVLGDKLAANWELELSRQNEKSSRPPSLIRSLLRTFTTDLIILAIPMLIEITLNITQSILLGKLLSHFRPVPLVSREDAMIYAGAMVLCTLISLVCRNTYELTAYHTGLRIRAACCSIIYRKALRLSSSAMGDMASGQVVNLLSNDVSRFDIMSIFFHYMWTAPLLTVVIMVLFVRDGGLPALCGFSVILSVTLAQSYIGKLSSKFRRYIALRTDERVRLVNEVISGIQVIKMYAWEKPFIALIRMARVKELFELRKTATVRAIFMTAHLCTTRLSLFVSILAVSMVGTRITSDKVFVFHSYYNVISWALSGMFVRGCAELSESYTSIQRIQSFLLKEEFTSVPSIENKNGKHENEPSKKNEETKALLNGTKPVPFIEPLDENCRLMLDNVEAKWNLDSPNLSLDKMSFSVAKGQLLAIIGPVGAGKSSVLQSILGELKPLEGKGSVKINGKISYASQDSWVFAATVRQNILFGSAYDKKRYEKVVKSCALLKDFEQFPQGDFTIIGERGVSLSGGQKARINLARAVYRDADIYLLDDPLSAVDTHVGQHLFDECMRGILRQKTVVLVTHQLQYLKGADLILLIQNGRSVALGTYQEIVNTGIDYAKLLKEEEDNDDSKSEASNTNELVPQQLSLRRSTSRERKKSNVSSFTSSLVSLHSQKSDGKEEQPQQPTSPLVDKMEASSKGVVEGSVYLHYFKASGSLLLLLVVIFFFILTQIAASGTDYWVAYWTKIEDNRPRLDGEFNSTYPKVNYTAVPMNNTASDAVMPLMDLSTDLCAYIYAGLAFSTLFICVIRSAVYYYLVLRISQRLHDFMFSSVIAAPMRFFDTNPSGRILNRFAKDMGSVDEILPKIILDSSQVILNLAGSFTLTVITNYFLLIPLSVMFVILRCLQKFYLKTSKDVKRIEGMVRSPVFSHLNVSLQGMVTIRAFGAQRLLKEEFDKHQDLHSGAWFMHLAGSSAFSFLLEFTTLCYNMIVLISLFAYTQESSGGEVGLAITQCMSLLGMLQWGIRQSTEVANNMMATERIIEYVQLPPEQKALAKESKLAVDWPQKGCVKLDHVYLKYSDDEDPVLRDLNITIQPGEKVGIVGRTGAGKSSLIATLFRMAVVEGHVVIDDVDTGNVTLTKLRSSISIIPQDPVLFSGTMRYNLDPFNEYKDEKLWQALDEVELKDVLSSELGLNSRVLERGSNFSVGQRQLVCLARAILRANKILMMDEATANVDPQTDKLIQTTIREKFKACTVLTVAHRLNTVIDSDRVLVMDSGSVVEFDHPHKLLERPGGVFTGMINQLEGHGAEQLKQTAKQHYKNHHAPAEN
ncbi:multidrug resistance-associated protein 4-like isoform X2 [Thrips palmi]|uniref:Multidrug resistance-associated protein 4-like isoform X2 n=1 Tax=Thrips palmi TaxID=161013 RepID=A0A6P9A9S1_THRPL|nr:multidrug resistance-associated protein 4-like isoform X2 [Thrips palmi]